MRRWKITLLLALATGYALASDAPQKTEPEAKSSKVDAGVAAPTPIVRKPAPVIVRKPVHSRSRVAVTRKKKTTGNAGKVLSLPANQLPPGAIVPSQKKIAVHADKAAPSPAPQPPAYVLTDPDLRWQFYSYP